MKYLFNRLTKTNRLIFRLQPGAEVSAEAAQAAAAQTPLSAEEIQGAATQLGERVTLTPGQLPNTPEIQAEAEALAGQNEVLANILIAAIQGGLESIGNNSQASENETSTVSSNPYHNPNANGESVDLGPVRPGVMGLLDSIAIPESGGDYEIMVRGARWPGGLANATVGELCQTQAAKGRYQIVGPTMEGLIDYMGLTGNERFTPDLQDQMAVALLRRDCGLDSFQAGTMSAGQFRDRISRVWAGIAGSNGRGHYDGDRYGNRASHSIPDNVLASVRADTTRHFA